MCTVAMETPEVSNATAEATAKVAEAGSREAPALPPGLLMEGEAATRPTKLFIGGISRHTTTKQLRDHFSQFGRVLDCVAMRQPDGRPRGFGYVTLDSPTAAERCLREPQLIDNRIVDMKPAVPEGSGSYSTSPKEAGFNPCMFPGQADFNMDMFGAPGFNGWPDADAFGAPWWSGARASPHGQGLDCLELLSAARELAVSQTSSPHGLPLHHMSLSEYGECASAAWEDDEPQSTLIPEAFQQPPGACQKMSASAPEFVPMSSQAPEPSPKAAESQKVAAATPARKAPAARAPLGELNTNVIVEVSTDDLLKPFKSPTNKPADMGRGHLGQGDSPAENTGVAIGLSARPTGLLLDDDLDASSPSAASSSELPEESTPEPVSEKAQEETSDKASNADAVADAQAPVSSRASESSEGNEVEMPPVDLENLPSMGSALHATGECKRCNFFPKGRCQNGKNCQFCHFPHDKRKPSRQEKRERRAAWLDQQGEQEDPSTDEQSPVAKVGPLLSEMRPDALTGPLLSKHGLHQGGFPFYPGECDETLAYSIFPGLPPIHATKLPAPLPLPGMEMTSQTGPALPPGLVSQAWPAEGDSLLFEQRGLQQVVTSTARTLAPLATVPTPLSTTPASTPAATPTAAGAKASGETGPAKPPGLLEPEVAPAARTLAPLATAPTPLSATPASTPMSTPLVTPTAAMVSTSGTQTGDYKCRRCEIPGGKTLKEVTSTEIADEDELKGCQWTRDELLRLRDGVMKLQASEKTSSVMFRTAAIGPLTSN